MKRSLLRGETLVPTVELGAVYDSAIRDLMAHSGGEQVTYFEAGVFAGESMTVMVRAARARGVELDAWGVDSFEGLPNAVVDDEGSWVPGDFFCPRPVTEWNLRRQGVALSEVELVEDWFDDVLTPELAERVGGVEIAMLDAGCGRVQLDGPGACVPGAAAGGPRLADLRRLVLRRKPRSGDAGRSGHRCGAGV